MFYFGMIKMNISGTIGLLLGLMDGRSGISELGY